MQIDSYSFGEIEVNGKKYTNDLIIFPNRVKDNWWRDEGHLLQVQDLKEVFEENPGVLIVGKGANGRMDVSQEVEERCEREGVELRAMKTEKVKHVFNKLENQKNVFAAIHLTC